ncbi:hypothetical protein SAMN04488128_1011388 [Chitinophaga eiseniae]|uniref:Uncharacterized protein n=1 Tax=Chitinophaga eiseniae TaxID=634771 RepID=A0A1T4N2L3_9BACT|nr:hypothetical protein [Chitinophaga eiseniae]SJZ73364.1 hypothetical protein SAMN04488128_1011388 [Chitinophaga eiseniae]
METTDNNLEPLQGLKIITEVIARTRENAREHSYLFLLWGWLIAASCILFFLLRTFTSFKLFFLPFPVLVAAGIFLSFRHYHSGPRAVQTYLGFYLKNLWLVLGICFLVSVLINVLQHQQPFTGNMLIGGAGTLVTGLVLRFRPLISGGILFFMLAVASIFVPGQYAPLLLGIAVLGGYLAPGYLLKKSTI